MNRTSYAEKQKYVKTEKELEKKHYRIIVALIVGGLVYRYFLMPKTIGGDWQYLVYVFCLPTFVGMLALGYYRRRFLINRFATNRGIVLWSFMTLFYLVQGVMFSYLSAGQAAGIVWDVCNQQVAAQSPVETVECDVTRFMSIRGSFVDIRFQDQHERLYTTYRHIKPYLNKPPQDFKVRLHVQRGIWMHYVIKDWGIVVI